MINFNAKPLLLTTTSGAPTDTFRPFIASDASALSRSAVESIRNKIPLAEALWGDADESRFQKVAPTAEHLSATRFGSVVSRESAASSLAALRDVPPIEMSLETLPGETHVIRFQDDIVTPGLFSSSERPKPVMAFVMSHPADDDTMTLPYLSCFASGIDVNEEGEVNFEWIGTIDYDHIVKLYPSKFSFLTLQFPQSSNLSAIPRHLCL